VRTSKCRIVYTFGGKRKREVKKRLQGHRTMSVKNQRLESQLTSSRAYTSRHLGRIAPRIPATQGVCLSTETEDRNPDYSSVFARKINARKTGEIIQPNRRTPRTD